MLVQRIASRLGAGLLLFPLMSGGAVAATAISYSPRDSAYGWCAGYAPDEAGSCADRWCGESGGTACEVVLRCDGGWGAVAFSQEPRGGIGATCGRFGSTDARIWALFNCIAAVKSLCWTHSTFDQSGNAASEAANQEFDRVFLTQLLLQTADHDPGQADGRAGGQTRTAIEAFQLAEGLPVTGTPSADVLQALLAATGGPEELVSLVATILVASSEKTTGHYADAAPTGSVSESRALRMSPRRQRSTVLATHVTFAGFECATPAQEDRFVGYSNEAGNWLVTCHDGERYHVIVEHDGNSKVAACRDLQGTEFDCATLGERLAAAPPQ